MPLTLDIFNDDAFGVASLTAAIYAARKKKPSRPAAVKTATPQAPIPQAPTP